MYLRGIGWKFVGWIHLVQDRDIWLASVSTVMILLVPQNAGNFSTDWETVSFSRMTLLHGIRRGSNICHTDISHEAFPFLQTNIGACLSMNPVLLHSQVIYFKLYSYAVTLLHIMVL
jgi:hypothetical protein